MPLPTWTRHPYYYFEMARIYTQAQLDQAVKEQDDIIKMQADLIKMQADLIKNMTILGGMLVEIFCCVLHC